MKTCRLCSSTLVSSKYVKPDIFTLALCTATSSHHYLIPDSLHMDTFKQKLFCIRTTLVLHFLHFFKNSVYIKFLHCKVLSLCLLILCCTACSMLFSHHVNVVYILSSKIVNMFFIAYYLVNVYKWHHGAPEDNIPPWMDAYWSAENKDLLNLGSSPMHAKSYDTAPTALHLAGMRVGSSNSKACTPHFIQREKLGLYTHKNLLKWCNTLTAYYQLNPD